MIIFKHKETNQAHVYELKSRLVYIVALLTLLLPVVLIVTNSSTILNTSSNIFLVMIWAIVWGVLLIDVIPMYLKQTVAAIRGKTIVTSGSLFTKENPKVEVHK